MVAERDGGEVGPAVQHAGGVRDGEAVALVPEPVGRRDPAVLEDQLAEAETVESHRRLLRTGPEPGAIGFDQESGESLRSRTGSDHDAVQIAHVTVADEDLAAVQDVVVAVPHRAGAHAEHVTAGLGLGDRDGRQALAGGDDRQPGLALLVAAEVDDLRRAQLRGLHHGAHGAAHPRELLDDDGLGQVAGSHAAVLLADCRAQPALLGDAPGQFVVDRPGRLHLGYPWPNLTLCEVADRLPELMMQAAAEVAVHPSPSREAPDRQVDRAGGASAVAPSRTGRPLHGVDLSGVEQYRHDFWPKTERLTFVSDCVSHGLGLLGPIPGPFPVGNFLPHAKGNKVPGIWPRPPPPRHISTFITKEATFRIPSTSLPAQVTSPPDPPLPPPAPRPRGAWAHTSAHQSVTQSEPPLARAPRPRTPRKPFVTTRESAVLFSCAFGQGKPQVRRAPGRGAAW